MSTPLSSVLTQLPEPTTLPEEAGADDHEALMNDAPRGVSPKGPPAVVANQNGVKRYDFGRQEDSGGQELEPDEGDEPKDTREANGDGDRASMSETAVPETDDGTDSPDLVTAGNESVPEDLQERLDALIDGGQQPRPGLYRAVELLAGAEGSPTEQFVVQSYMGGQVTLDDAVDRLESRDFLTADSTVTAADVLFGSRQTFGAEHDLMNRIYADGLIDMDTFVADVNDAVKMDDLALGAEEGRAVYASGSHEALEARFETMDFDEDAMKSLLRPGVDLDAGPPSVEQLAVFHHLAAGRDQKFLELVTMWLTENNSDYSLEIGHPTAEAKAAGEPAALFWAKDGEAVSDPFLDALLEVPNGGDEETLEKLASAHLDGSDATSRTVRFSLRDTAEHQKSSWDGPGDEQTDHTRWLDNLLFPEGNIKGRLREWDDAGVAQIVLGDLFENEAGRVSRPALEMLDPTFADAVRVVWINGVDEVSEKDESHAGKTVLYIDDAKDFEFVGGGGEIEAYAHRSTLELSNNAGAQLPEELDQPAVMVTAAPDAPRVDTRHEGRILGRLHGLETRPDEQQLFLDLANTPEPLRAVIESQAPLFLGLGPEQKIFLYNEAIARLTEPSSAGPDVVGSNVSVLDTGGAGPTSTADVDRSRPPSYAGAFDPEPAVDAVADESRIVSRESARQVVPPPPEPRNVLPIDETTASVPSRDVVRPNTDRAPVRDEPNANVPTTENVSDRSTQDKPGTSTSADGADVVESLFARHGDNLERAAEELAGYGLSPEDTTNILDKVEELGLAEDARREEEIKWTDEHAFRLKDKFTDGTTFDQQAFVKHLESNAPLRQEVGLDGIEFLLAKVPTLAD